MEILDLSDFFTTKPQAVDFSARLTLISDKIYETNFDLENTLQEQFGIQKKNKFISLLRKNKVPVGSGSALTKFLAQILEATSSLPTATMTLAIEPKKEILKEISNWFLLNLKHQILIDIQVNPDIVAGATIGYQGKQLNASIKPVFDETYATSLNSTSKNIVNEEATNTNKSNG